MKNYFILLIAFSIIIGCSKDDSHDKCSVDEVTYATSINSPSTGEVDNIIVIEVHFDLRDSCHEFNDFSEVIDGNSRTIEVNTKYDTCQNCLLVITSITKTYSFKASAPGDYELKFRSGENEYILVVITIT